MKNSLSIALIYSVLLSCSSKKDETDQCIYAVNLPAVEVSDVENGTVNEPLRFNIKSQYHNGCGSFKDFSEKTEGNIITVVVNGMNMGCICTQAFVHFDKDYVFVPKQAGTYTFKFKSTQNSYIERQVVVN